MRAVVCQFIYEANTFCAQRGEVSLFRDGGVWIEGASAVRKWAEGVSSQTTGSLRGFAKAGWHCDAVFVAQCGSPSGRLSRTCYSQIRAALRKILGEALPADAVVMHLHGAAAAEGEDDPEGDLLRMVREELNFRGCLALSLDLHANMTKRMARHADIVTAYRTMPRVDVTETGERAARLAIAGRKADRVIAKIRALVPPIDTTDVDGRFAEVLALARKAESFDEIDDVSLLPVQPWLDVDELGSAVVVTGRSAKAETVAREIAETWYGQRKLWGTAVRSWDDILKKLSAGKRARPWILVDANDATSGGSDGTSAEALLKSLPAADRLAGEVLLTVVDPATVASAHAIGLGRKGRFAIGQQKIAVEGTVLHLGVGSFRASGRLYSNASFSMNGAAVISIGKLRIVAACSPTMVIDRAYYQSVGLDAGAALAVQSKSIMSWRAAFSDLGIAPEDGLYTEGPGQTPLDVRRLTYRGVGRECFPNTAEPKEPIAIWRSDS